MEEFKFSIGEKEFTVELPLYLIPLVRAQMERHILHPNIKRSPMCLTCGVNYTRLSEDLKSWVTSHMCKQCDLTNPCLIQYITDIIGFPNCQMAWYLSKILNIPTAPSVYMVEGQISHEFDNFLLEYFSKKENYEYIKQFYPSRTKMTLEINKLLNEEYDKIIDRALKESEIEGKQNTIGQLLLSQKDELFSDVLSDYAYIFAKRLYNDIKHSGEFTKLLLTKWIEKKVIGYDTFYDIRMFQVGRIDKLYTIKPNKFVIQDDKSSRAIRYWGEDIYSEAGTQLGGYAHCLQQLYNYDVHVLGAIWLLRYFYHTYIPCDVDSYVKILSDICKFIKERKAPLKRQKNTGMCHEQYCDYYKTYCFKSPLER